MLNKGLLIVISAPSGAGKSTICGRYLKEHPDTAYSISVTTRKPRKGEKEGKDYYFVSEKEFKSFIKKGDFLEYAGVFGEYYGTRRSSVEDNLNKGKNVLLDIDVKGALQLMKKINGIFVFVLPPSKKVLVSRLKERKTDKKAEIVKRLKIANQELAYINKYDYVIINDKLSDAVSNISLIIQAEKHSVINNGAVIEKCVKQFIKTEADKWKK